jgi:hypothetical protein
MSIATTPECEQAAKIRQGLTERVEAIRAQMDLTDEDKLPHIAKAAVSAQTEMQRLATAK